MVKLELEGQELRAERWKLKVGIGSWQSETIDFCNGELIEDGFTSRIIKFLRVAFIEK